MGSRTFFSGAFRPDRSLLHLPFPLQLGVVEATRVAEGPRPVGASSPFRRIDPVAAVASAGRSSALISLRVSRNAPP